MRAKSILATLLLLVAGLQTAWGQGFRVYKSDGTVAQFSLRTDSIVFYDGIGSDVDFGPFTPVNQMIAGTWYKSKSETVTFNEDGTTDYIAGGTYTFLPYQGNIIISNASGAPMSILKVYSLTSEQMLVGKPGSETFSVWSTTEPQPASDEHEWVDLGLPSGTKWATCNVGASSPEEYGDYFAWGETTTKSTYDWSTYFDTDDDGDTFKKYNNNGGLTELLPEDDAATKNWGSPWHMPTYEQIEELLDNCTREWTTQGGVNGTLVTGPNGNTIFLPAAGRRWDGGLYHAGSYGGSWSSSLLAGGSRACYLYFDSGGWDWYYYGRYYGQSVRAVRP